MDSMVLHSTVLDCCGSYFGSCCGGSVVHSEREMVYIDKGEKGCQREGEKIKIRIKKERYENQFYYYVFHTCYMHNSQSKPRAWKI